MIKRIAIDSSVSLPHRMNLELIEIAKKDAPSIAEMDRRQTYFLALAATALAHRVSGRVHGQIHKKAKSTFEKVLKAAKGRHRNADLKRFAGWTAYQATRVLG